MSASAVNPPTASSPDPAEGPKRSIHKGTGEGEGEGPKTSGSHEPVAPPASAASHSGHGGPSHEPKNLKDLSRIALGALGVVYGDIGTSPLYAVKECFNGPHGVSVTPENVLGILSLVFWSLTLVIVVKYLSFIMRADNHGEGGILALLALIGRPEEETDKGRQRRRRTLVLFGLFGAALLYGDGIITPAVSVLSAVEGLQVEGIPQAAALKPFVVPITCGILLALFLIQKRGTAGIGRIFGPATLLWFISIAAVALPWILRAPQVLQAINPYYAVKFFAHAKLHGFLVLGAVVLCITGGEALYADMGHFGKRAIRLAWYAVVFPALLLNYFGQGAVLLLSGGNPEVVKNPFYSLVPHAFLYPMVLIATVAASVASQALISGVYSLTRQALQLGYFPRTTIVHTSGETEGQIYIPEVNWALMAACLALVAATGDSSKLAAAYGIAVTGTMGITSLLFAQVAMSRWGWPLWRIALMEVLFLSLDLGFFSANAIKIEQGGWFPLAVAALVFTVMTTWKKGREALAHAFAQSSLPMEMFLKDLEHRHVHRVSGTAVFMTSNLSGVPGVLLHHFKHNKVLHEQVVLLSVITERVPEVPRKDRVQVKELPHNFYQVVARYGFMQTPNVPEIMQACRAAGLKTQKSDTSYFLGRETLLTTGRTKLARWRKALFAILSRNARPATQYFSIPANRVVELGAQIEL